MDSIISSSPSGTSTITLNMDLLVFSAWLRKKTKVNGMRTITKPQICHISFLQDMLQP
eukprot:m.252557 g.252557  ORF g.252557 m.252557 type:complete len:58 (-) comp16155_c0_seq28:1653-1826(-)